MPPLTELVFDSMILYANAFSADLGRCFRLVCRASTWQPMRCPGEVSTRGWWQDGTGMWWVVDACREHAGPLRKTRPAGTRVGQPAHGSGSKRPGRTQDNSKGRSVQGGTSDRRLAA
jgi:hypothetical protein